MPNNQQFYFADVNGDGKADLVTTWHDPGCTHSANATAGICASVALSNGTGYTRTWLDSINTDYSPNNQQFYFADVNGDGKADLVTTWHDPGCIHSAGATEGICASVALSNGTGYTRTWFDSINTDYLPNNQQFYFADVNGDGRADLVTTWHDPACTHSANATAGICASVALSNGTGYTRTWFDSINTDYMPNNQQFYFADVNGDGKADLVTTWHDPACTHSANATEGICASVNLAPGPIPDLLTTAHNGLGATTTIAYAPSTNMPDPIQTVSSITTDDGRGVTGVSRYSYSGWKVDSANHEALGFGTVKDVFDTGGDYTETTYQQTVQSSGKPASVSTKNSAGAIYSYSTYQYAESSAAPFTSVLSQQDDYTCNLTSHCRDKRVSYSYDSYGNQTQATEYGDLAVIGDGRMTVTSYVPNTTAYLVNLPSAVTIYSGLLSSPTVSPPKVKQTTYYYDGATSATSAPTQGLLSRTDAWNDQSNTIVTTTQLYDAYGNPTVFTDARGQSTTKTYDPTYHLYVTKTCNALNQCASSIWDYTLGMVTSTTDANGATTSTSYDALGRTTSQTDPAGHTTTWQYLNIGDPTKQHVRMSVPDGSPDGEWTETYTDGLGRTYKTLKKGAGSTNYEQDTTYSDTLMPPQKRSLWFLAGGTPVWESYTYDGLGRLTGTTHADSSASSVSYTNDTSGKPQTTTTDELGHARTVWIDAYDRTSVVQEQNGSATAKTTYQYDALNRLIQTTDSAGNKWTATYDALGRKTASTSPDLGAWRYTYDAGGLLLSQTDAKGQTTTYTYDALGRRLTKVVGGQTTNWSYDEAGHGASLGRLTDVTYPAGGKSYSWNALGQQTALTACVGTTCESMSYTYDPAGRLATLTYPDGEVVTDTYAADGNLNSVSNYVSSMSWSPAGQLMSLTDSNGAKTAYSYDANRLWLTSATTQNSAKQTLYTAGYTYDVAGRVRSMSQGTPSAQTSNYTYDDLNRLTGVSGAQSQSFTYDALGNVTSNSLVGSYTYGDAAHPHAVTKAGTTTLSYDADGNMIAGCGRAYTWTAENQLASVSSATNATCGNAPAPSATPTATPTGGGSGSASATTTYAYDEAGQRVSKTTGSTVTLYFGPDVESVNGTMTQYYYAGNMLVAQKAGGAKSWYHTDRQGSIRLMTDSSGAMVASYDYQPFGGIQSQTGAVSNERGYTGHFMDGESGLIYMNARYEDPTLARFVSADDTIGDATNPQDLNAYSYALNSPINNTDPTGHMNECECGADTGAVSPVPPVDDTPPPQDSPPQDPYNRAGGNMIPTDMGVATQAQNEEKNPDMSGALMLFTSVGGDLKVGTVANSSLPGWVKQCVAAICVIHYLANGAEYIDYEEAALQAALGANAPQVTNVVPVPAADIPEELKEVLKPDGDASGDASGGGQGWGPPIQRDPPTGETLAGGTIPPGHNPPSDRVHGMTIFEGPSGSIYDPIPEGPSGSIYDPIPEGLSGSIYDPILERSSGSIYDPIPERSSGSIYDPIPERLSGFFGHLIPRW
jgi:RHS repeat-associated protein